MAVKATLIDHKKGREFKGCVWRITSFTLRDNPVKNGAPVPGMADGADVSLSVEYDGIPIRPFSWDCKFPIRKSGNIPKQIYKYLLAEISVHDENSDISLWVNENDPIEEV